ncbi:hypothetical protein Asppvi_003842 [Aspergillus pseudoviridinutans]|uniref:BTB domain-containing protein n=1 Tax=Aspergillus pseudoviridinutans TaxID=1517512 RepID=A0A9P3B578_9EURO|nr:uncharacterized protein Asppvi_003842 [Aspergillus pseudoviridinutans]GIJ84987.1 hypothetical protein Asppvi_003842 [Aspergillus pseudoviridinutans]
MTEQPIIVQELPEIEYHQPLSSPYVLPMVTVNIGDKSYGIPGQYLRKCPQLDRDWSSDPNLTLTDVHEDAGHTFANFLYTGTYETTRSTLDHGTSRVATEFRRSVLVYQASRTYGLPILEALARRYLEYFGESIPILDIIIAAREVFPKLPDDETWFPSYIKRRLQQSLGTGGLKFIVKELSSCIAGEERFGFIIMKMMLDILAARLQRLDDEFNEKGKHHGTQNNEGIGLGDVQVPAIVHEERVPLPNDYSAPEEPVSVCDAYAAPEEPVPASEVYRAPEEPVPVPEKLIPVPDNYAAPEEPVSLPDDYPTPEEPPVYAAESHHGRVSLADVSLYENWKSLSPKKRKKRIQILAKKGLPVPNKDGIITVLVG